MSELSTADLAGGTTPRTRAADRAMDDTQLDESVADRDVAARPSGVDHADMDAHESAARPMPMPQSDPMPMPQGRPSSRLANPAAHDGADRSADAALFPAGEAEDFRGRWTEVQTGFVDEPRSAVQDADSLVAEMMQRLAKVFAEERARLEEQWSRGDDISTEDLRQALRRYRSFFDRLLSV
jgi:hypothetical protein